MKGMDHYVFIKDNGKAQVVYEEGRWVTEHIRTAILKFNYEIDKIDKLFIRDFTEEEIKEYEKNFFIGLVFFCFLTSFTTAAASNSINLFNIEAKNTSCSNLCPDKMCAIFFYIIYFITCHYFSTTHFNI